MFDLHKKLKEYFKYKNTNATNVYLWYDLDSEEYIVTILFTSDFINKLNLKYQLIK